MEIVLGFLGICVAILFNCWSLWSTKKSQQQNVDVQLLKERYDAYLLLQKWCDIANRLVDRNDMNGIELLFTWGNIGLINFATDFLKMEKKRSNDPNNENSGDTRPNYILMNVHFRNIVQEEYRRLKMAKYLYNCDNFNNIEEFTDEFFDIVKDILRENKTTKKRLSKLKNILNTLINDDVFDNMTRQIGSLKDSL